MSAMWTNPQIKKFLYFALGYLLTEVMICPKTMTMTNYDQDNVIMPKDNDNDKL